MVPGAGISGCWCGNQWFLVWESVAADVVISGSGVVISSSGVVICGSGVVISGSGVVISGSGVVISGSWHSNRGFLV